MSFSLTDSFFGNTSIARLAKTEERHSDYQIVMLQSSVEKGLFGRRNPATLENQ